MYRRDMGRQWLEQSISGELELSLVTQPVLSEELEAYEVSPLVNSPDERLAGLRSAGLTPNTGRAVVAW